MYAQDYDGGTVLTDHEPTSTWAPPTWSDLLQPYIKNLQLPWDPSRPDKAGRVYGGYDPSLLTTFAINDAGTAGYFQGSWQNWGAYIWGRNLYTQEYPAERMHFMPIMWAGTDVGWYYLRNYEASWIDTDTEYTDWSWYNNCWQTRKFHSGETIPVAYLDGHAGKANRGKFISWNEAPGRADWDRLMRERNLYRFWGNTWSSTE
jgi:hypothetical protein